jgi:Tc5 transposase DNA-binding domain/DDE superfamily endonuclease
MVGERISRGHSDQKRKSYSLKFKHDVITEYQHGVKGKGFAAIAKKYGGFSTGTIRGWHKNRDAIAQALKNRDVETRTRRRLFGGGRRVQYQDVEDRVKEWILDHNAKGLRVKDQYIRAKARRVYKDLSEGDNISSVESDTNAEDEEVGTAFRASSGWCARFKIRNSFVSRCQTSSRQLPADAPAISMGFIQQVQSLIEVHRIKYENILNMDQVPRYFETEPASTITTKGSRNVLLKKGGTSHKRFTVTFTVSAAGEMLKPHVLFSKLKKKPSCAPGFLVNVNKTGMWSDEIFIEHAQKTLLSRRQTAFLREPVLYIIDSYGVHVKAANTKRLAKHNIFIVIVPPNMTNILQPLDVAINRSFQAFYASRYDKYIENAISDVNMQTNAGNPKCPDYLTVTTWCQKWIDSFPSATIVKAFAVCGLVPKPMFNINDLHPPLKALLSTEYDPVEWARVYTDTLDLIQAELPELVPQAPTYFLPEEGPRTLIVCVLFLLHGQVPDEDEVDKYFEKLILYMLALDDMKEIFNGDDAEGIRDGSIALSMNEVYAIAHMLHWDITVSTIDEHCKVLTEKSFYFSDKPEQNVYMQQLGDYFTCYVGGSAHDSENDA